MIKVMKVTKNMQIFRGGMLFRANVQIVECEFDGNCKLEYISKTVSIVLIGVSGHEKRTIS